MVIYPANTNLCVMCGAAIESEDDPDVPCFRCMDRQAEDARSREFAAELAAEEAYYSNPLGSSAAYLDYVSEGDPYGGIGGQDDW